MEKETNGNGRPSNKPGIYRHPESGAEMIARQHRKFGSAQADGYVAVGYVYVGPEPKVSAKAEAKESLLEEVKESKAKAKK